MIIRLFTLAIALSVVILIMPSCTTYHFRSNYGKANSLIHESTNLHQQLFLKAHLKNGDIVILTDTWLVDTTLNVVNGNGTKYDFNRKRIADGIISIPIDSVAIFETNKKLVSPEAGRIAALSILAGVDAAVSILCIMNPKACFGSCPTFYMNGDDNFHYADAEGFTNAISPSMEYADIDALGNRPLSSNNFSITMKNEALETHCVKEVKLLAYPRNPGERVFQSPANEFYLCENIYSPGIVTAGAGDITALLNHEDKLEYFSASDGHNLNSKEEILITFTDVANTKDLGLILNFRQTLMTTYMFYSAMGYMGDEVGDIFARLETDSVIRKQFDAATRLLGGIDVYILDEVTSDWKLQSSFYETGPIAINKQFIPLDEVVSGAEVKLKLVLNKGLWRIEYLALANIKEVVQPITIAPVTALYKGEPDNSALRKINHPETYLISMPGCEYKFGFTLPDENTDYELFLSSKGYYLEWMRGQWIKDKDLLKLRQMVYSPEQYLKAEAQNFKRYEGDMEIQFWNSRIDTKTFSYYE